MNLLNRYNLSYESTHKCGGFYKHYKLTTLLESKGEFYHYE
jgi:hypothetical protein